MVSCKDYVAIRREELKNEIASFDRAPHLAVVQVGNDPASDVYIRNKKKECKYVGIEFTHINLPGDVKISDVMRILLVLSDNDCIDGIMLQLPLPKHLNADVDVLLNFIAHKKDVDGFNHYSDFDPCTPKGIMNYLKYNNVELEGKRVVMVGRSKIVGIPLVNMMIKDGATVTCCNSKTECLDEITREAHIVISAIGKPKYFGSKYFNHDQIIIDVGINRDENGKLCGDVDYDRVMNIYRSYVTPVPGGVGKLTVCALLENVVEAYKRNNL
jgi:methylenetetrahydrofolate dehydrogenase (NADP+)/methenyltetrahydrofolate cyclohydrolase